MYTTRLFDRGMLLGTHVGGSRAAFKSATSVFNRANPTVIDFSSFQDGSVDGAIEVTIDRGLVNLYRVSDELNIGHAEPDLNLNYGFAPSTFEILHGTPVPTPEPAPIFLLLTGLAGLQLRKRVG